MVGFLFDLDGVIIDTESEYSKIWKKINEEFPSGIIGLEEKIKGTTLDNILITYYPDEKMRQQVADRLHELEGKMQYKYCPGAYEFLNNLSKNNLPKVLVTSSDNEKMKNLFLQLPELKHSFDYIITAEQVKTSKPDPEGYLLGANKIGIKPENCIVFEDSLQGVKAGKAASAYVIGIEGTFTSEQLSEYSDIIKDNLSDIDIQDLIEKVSIR